MKKYKIIDEKGYIWSGRKFGFGYWSKFQDKELKYSYLIGSILCGFMKGEGIKCELKEEDLK